MNRDLLRSELIRDEGARKNSAGVHIAYKDSLGFWTIGYGHLMGKVPTMVTATETQALAMLETDINAAEKLARSLVPLFDKLTDEQQRATVNMAFNRGGHLAKSKSILPAILEASAGGSWARVRQEIAASEWRSQVGPRADRIAAQYDPPPGLAQAEEGFA